MTQPACHNGQQHRDDELHDNRAQLAALTAEFADLQAAYHELQKSEARYRLMFENVPLGYMSMDENARLIDMNKAFADFFGYRHDEIIGKQFADLLAAGVEYHRKVSFPAFKRRGYSKDIVWDVRKKSGEIATIVMNGRVRYDEDGNFIQTHCMMMDITEYRKAEEALRKSEREKALILGAMSERVIYHDENRRIIWANQIAAETAGMPLEEMAGKFCFELLRNRHTPCEDCPAMLAFQTRTAHAGEIQVDGKILQMTAHPVVDQHNRFVGVVQISADITERKQLERELLDISSKERRRIGHDLHDGMGQQLTGISFLATALQQQLSDLQPDAAETAARIAESADSALKLMRSILQGLCLVTAEPQGLMSALAVLASNTTEICRLDCRFSCSKPVMLQDYTTASHLFYIAHEAVCNAVKHSGCSRIRISLEQQHRSLRLSIKDNGCGFISLPGEQTGMGQRTMRYRASIIGATLEIKGTKGKGTTISCLLPSSLLQTKE